MSTVDTEKQRKFFDVLMHQYPEHLLEQPLYHTLLEQKEIEQRVQPYKKGSVIDFGAGSGRISIFLLQQGYTVTAVDISSESLKVLRRNAKKLGLSGLKTTDVVPETDVDAIVGADVLHHVDMDEFLPLFHARLRKSGKIVFSEPGAFNIAWYIFLFVFHNWEVEKGMMNCTYFNLMRLLKKYNYRNITLTGVGLLPTPLFNWSKFLTWLNHKAGNLPVLKLFAYRYIVEASR